MTRPETAETRSGWLVGLIALAGGLAAPMSMPVAGPVAGPLAAARPVAETASPAAARLTRELDRAGADREVAAFYEARGHRPLWIAGRRARPEAARLIELLKAADADGLDPSRYRVRELEAALADAQDGRLRNPMRVEAALSQALAAWGSDLHRAPPAAELLYTDPELRPPALSRRAVLETVARAPSLDAGLSEVARMNPIYRRLRTALAEETALNGPNVGLLRANLERARALPTSLGRRFILVDIPSQRLWMYEDGRPVGGMRVVVGRASDPTPPMAALVRYAVFRPYWNVPPDLVARNMAPKVVAGGLDYLEGERLEALSDWTDEAAPLDPAQIDWPAVAAGRVALRVRQLPGPSNMMGQVKFMFPNDRGVYLHDSPIRDLFGGDVRLGSAGCVRLEDAARLARWLFGEAIVAAGQGPGPPETRVDLDEPTPVYITYFTAVPTMAGLGLRKDIYQRDATLMAQFERPAAAAIASRAAPSRQGR